MHNELQVASTVIYHLNDLQKFQSEAFTQFNTTISGHVHTVKARHSSTNIYMPRFPMQILYISQTQLYK